MDSKQSSIHKGNQFTIYLYFYIFKACHFAYIPLFIMSIRCNKFEIDPSKEFCSVISWSQFTNPCTLPNQLSSDLANAEQSVFDLLLFLLLHKLCAFRAKTSDRQQAIYKKAGHLLNDSAPLGEINYVICKKHEKKSVKKDSCKFPTGVILTCTSQLQVTMKKYQYLVSICWKMLIKDFYLLALSCRK